VEPLLSVKDLHVAFHRDIGTIPVLNGVDITLAAGESLGIVGESGSGKTVLVRAILRLLEHPWQIDKGRVMFDGSDLLRRSEGELQQIRGKDIALTTAEPRKHLNPLICIGDQLVNVIRAHASMPRAAALERATDLLRSVGIPDPRVRLNAYPHELSGGMCQRVIIAMALAHHSKLMLVDEPTAGLDVTISRQILDLMQTLVRDNNAAMLLVSRDLGVVAHYCQRVAVIYAGHVVEVAKVADFFARPLHPYSRRLLRAAAAARDANRKAEASLGLRAAATAGCPYMPRCPVARAECAIGLPPMTEQRPGHSARCLRAGEVAAGELAA
jgi:oligopeptide/dipeptide ABC transporter ATP-binding protein